MKPYSDLSKIIHREGYIFIISAAVISLLLALISVHLGWIGFIITAWCIYFFRNPNRSIPSGEDLVVSPADGIVQNILEATPPEELGLGSVVMKRVSIFLNIFNVHVNRVPSSGRILALHYNPGKFLNASLDKASIHNERQSVLMENNHGEKIVFVQIAGLIARRIVCELEENSQVEAGDIFGIIRFGSRMDVYLPIESHIEVSIGQTCIGGETIISKLSSCKKVELLT